MDSTANDFILNSKGTCNYCYEYINRIKEIKNTDLNINLLIDNIKINGQGKKYDCIVGVSGGVDSSWALVKAVKLGLRPLAVHMDNGWNSELAQSNISNLIESLNVDLYTHVINWNEYKDLQKAFFKANVIDIELLYDNALAGVNYSQAREYRLKYILSGSNTNTEGVRMPPNWGKKNKLDYKNIKKIWSKFGKGYKIKSFPGYSFNQFFIDRIFKKILWIRFLDYFHYDKNKVVSLLQSDYGYTPYKYKHYESVFTRFYQGYILPNKFKVDKRKNHLSALILSGALSWENGVNDLKKNPYNDPNNLNEDINYFLKKIGWSREDLQEYINLPEISHSIYGSEDYKYDLYYKISSIVKSLLK
jgi:N-acetyl sugar amidotransferase